MGKHWQTKTNFNSFLPQIGWYTRRVGIASIYKMTELYLLQDKSPEHKSTWEFLSRRMEDGVHVQDFLSASDPKNVGRALGSAFETVGLAN